MNEKYLLDNEEINKRLQRITEIKNNNLNEDYMLGHSYFMKIESDEDLEFTKEYKIKPLLEEYFYADDTKLKEVLAIFNGEVND